MQLLSALQGTAHWEHQFCFKQVVYSIKLGTFMVWRGSSTIIETSLKSHAIEENAKWQF